MRGGLLFRLAASGILLGGAAQAQEPGPLPEGNAYVRGVLAGGPRSQDAAINDYSYDVAEMREELDKNGIVTAREVLAYEVYFVDTRPVRRLVSRNGVPLGPKEQAEVDLKAEGKARAIAAGRTVREQAGIRLSGLVNSFDFRTLGREVRAGRPTLMFDFKPRERTRERIPSERTTGAVARILRGRVHIDEADRRVVLLEARNTPGEKAKVATGVRVGTFELEMEFSAIDRGVWLPRRVMTLAAGRAFFFKTFRIRRTTMYWNYRKFSVETEEAPSREPLNR